MNTYNIVYNHAEAVQQFGLTTTTGKNLTLCTQLTVAVSEELDILFDYLALMATTKKSYGTRIDVKFMLSNKAIKEIESLSKRRGISLC